MRLLHAATAAGAMTTSVGRLSLLYLVTTCRCRCSATALELAPTVAAALVASPTKPLACIGPIRIAPSGFGGGDGVFLKECVSEDTTIFAVPSSACITLD